MKKYFSNIRTLAALLMAGAAFAACSSDDSNIIEQPANPSGEKVYTLTINASKGGAATRALELDGSKLVAKWETTDVLSVFKAASRSACIPANYLGTISPVAGTISADGDAATFRGTISGATAGDKLMLVYHPDAFTIDAYAAQTGTLASASALDCATAVVTVDAVSGTDVTITESKATFTTQTAMLKLTLTTDGSTTINPTSLKMTMALGTVTLKEFTFTPDAATYTANGNGVLYFALPSADDVATAASLKLGYAVSTTTLAGMKITYTATVGSDIYTVTKTGYSFEAGKYYAGTLTMTKLVVGRALTSAVVGDIVGSDGKAYAAADKDNLPSGVTAVAMVAYLGSASDCTNGLAIALENVSSNSLSWNNSSSKNGGKTAAEWCNAWNTSKPITGGTWRLPTIIDWQYMLIGCGASGTAEAEPSKYMNYDGLTACLTAAGGATLTSFYWSSTESTVNVNYARDLNFTGGSDGALFTQSSKTGECGVRACLAF